MKRWEQHKGKRINNLTLIGVTKTGSKYPGIFICDCGNKTQAEIYAVIKGKVKSCGCMREKNISISKTKHGASRANGRRETTEYGSWRAMRERCSNPNYAQYNDYGGRGIRICPEWSNFANFLRDMGPKPSPQHTLDRIDVDGNYEPGNCKWSTREEQNNNSRKNLCYKLLHAYMQYSFTENA